MTKIDVYYINLFHPHLPDPDIMGNTFIQFRPTKNYPVMKHAIMAFFANKLFNDACRHYNCKKSKWTVLKHFVLFHFIHILKVKTSIITSVNEYKIEIRLESSRYVHWYPSISYYLWVQYFGEILWAFFTIIQEDPQNFQMDVVKLKYNFHIFKNKIRKEQ